MVLSTDPTTSDDPRVEKKSIRDADCSATLKLLTDSGSFVLFASKSESQILGLQLFSIKDESDTKRTRSNLDKEKQTHSIGGS